MFTLYRKINHVNSPAKNLSIDELHNQIKNNPQRYLIEEIRQYKKNDDDYYKTLKKELNVITPFSTNTKKNKNCCTSLSGYIYLDIDNIPSIESTKQELIANHADKISLICLSSSGAGLSIFVPVLYQNTVDEMVHLLEYAVEYIKSLFPAYTFDSKTKDLARGLYISSDTEAYYKPDTPPIQLPKFDHTLIETKPVKTKTVKSKVDSSQTCLNIDEVLKVLKLQTEIVNENSIVDFNYIDDFTKIFIPKLIPDGSKRKIYYSIVCTLMYLNPGLESIYILSFINYINNTFAKPRMVYNEMVMHVNSIIKQIKEGKIDLDIVVSKKAKKFHFKKDSGLSPNEKRTFANQLNGITRKNDSINKMKQAIKELQESGEKVTKKSVANKSGIGLTTVKKYWSEDITDIYVVLDEINNIPVTVIDTIEKEDSNFSKEKDYNKN